MDREALLRLAERVAGGKGEDNSIDVAVEVALFSESHITARSNAAGTKVIYTEGGKEQTCWAPDWTRDRQGTAAALRAHAALAGE